MIRELLGIFSFSRTSSLKLIISSVLMVRNDLPTVETSSGWISAARVTVI